MHWDAMWFRDITVNKRWSMKLLVLAAVFFCSLIAVGQDVEVEPGKNSVSLTITATKSFNLLATEQKQPTLMLECASNKGKSGHLLLFEPGVEISEDNSETAPRNGALTLKMTIGNTKQPTMWIPYGGATVTFAYYGKTEPERLKFIQYLLTSPTASIQFIPFLVGQPVTSQFDISKLRDEAVKHPECGALQ
jgi:hypothetical protein